MNKLIIYCLFFVVLVSCKDDCIDPNISIIPNTKSVQINQNVKFDINGNADHIVFYSGEFSHKYEKKDDYLVNATLQLSWGSLGSFWLKPSEVLSLWYSTDFVSFDEFDSSKKTPQEYLLNANWTQIKNAEFSDIITNNNADLNQNSKFLFDVISIDNIKADNVTFAFKLLSNGQTKGNLGICDYKISAVSEDFLEPITISDKQKGWRNITMQTPEGKNPTWRERNNNTWDIQNAGGSTGKNMEMWLVLNSINTNKSVFNVPSDKGIVVKNYLNDTKSFEYKYKKPGTYKAYFEITNGDETGKSFKKQIVEFEINVVE